MKTDQMSFIERPVFPQPVNAQLARVKSIGHYWIYVLLAGSTKLAAGIVKN
jgi:hypothetical protein